MLQRRKTPGEVPGAAIKKRWIALGAVAVVATAGWAAFQQYWYYIPGILDRMRDPVHSNQPVVWQPGPAAAPAGQRRPNVLFILADDLGFNSLSFNGGGVAGGAMPTPNINSIARQGVRFTNGHAGNATCVPSRAAIMTGRYATRFGFEFTPTPGAFEKLIATFDYFARHGYYDAAHERDLPANAIGEAMPGREIMLAKLMHDRDYHTMFLSKWHLGRTLTSKPEAKGFDETLGFLAGASLFAPKADPTEKSNLVASSAAQTSTRLKELRSISVEQSALLWPSLALIREAIDYSFSYPNSPSAK